MKLYRWMRHLFCKSALKEIYCDLEGWGDFHSLYRCTKCGYEEGTDA